jgi:hypothetical protein
MERRTLAIWKRRSAESLAAIVRFVVVVFWVRVELKVVRLEDTKRNELRS